ncbi:MAG: hypothetical protein RMK81_04840 [Geminicoccaceae bacterium]|nr:hypothetical protein [Geminicoccaceae bacterium]MDW8369579.1 hypothetical protein [Geminicoccaceae bacterium]
MPRAVVFAATLLALLAPAATQAGCYTLELENRQLGVSRPAGEICAEDAIEARRLCRAEANRRNRDLPSREPLRFSCRPAS